MISLIGSFFPISPRRLLQPSVGYIGCALVVIVASVYWWNKRIALLAARVQKIESAFENIVLSAAENAILFPRATTPNEWIEGVIRRLQEFHEEVQKQPSNIPPDFQQRVKNLLDSAKARFRTIQPSTPPTSQSERTDINQILKEDLLHLDWTELVDQFAMLYRDCESLKLLQNSQILDHVRNYQTTLLLQIKEILLREKKLQGKEVSSELFSCLFKIHAIGRRLLAQTQEISKAPALTSSLRISGLPNSQNSCYLASALQFLRVLNVSELDPDMQKPIETRDDLNTKIKKKVCLILTRMNASQPIAKEGAELQELITQARINANSVAAQNDAAEVATKILGLFGFHLPMGIIQEEKRKLGKAHFDAAQIDDYRPALSIPKDTDFNVGAAIKKLIEMETESVEEFGDIKRQVTRLPDPMFVTFSCQGQFTLVNHLEFDDPLNTGYSYQLVFGMENHAHFGNTSTSGHWISHFRDDQGRWIVANDDLISSRSNPPEQLRYGYYVRKPKVAK